MIWIINLSAIKTDHVTAFFIKSRLCSTDLGTCKRSSRADHDLVSLCEGLIDSRLISRGNFFCIV